MLVAQKSWTESGAVVSSVPDNSDPGTSYEELRRIKLTFPDRQISVTAPLRNNPETLTPTP